MGIQLTDNLPNNISALLRVAIDDLVKTEADPRYKINMMEWHSPDTEPDDVVNELSLCQVCFAGAVMAQRLDADINEYYTPTDFGDDVARKLQTLDHIRTGNLYGAIQRFYPVDGNGILRDLTKLKQIEELQKMPFRSYGSDPVLFKECILDIANELEKIGL